MLPALVSVTTPQADLLLMVKPQFEVGKDRLGAGGVVRDTVLHADAVLTVVDAAADLGLALQAVVASPLPGPSGNVEYFVHLAADRPAEEETIRTMVANAIAAGPAGDPR
ncbi:SAM-dependent methyltransferase [Ruania alba]|uniref:SAM-dependent methyltransferase n=1 Tax=Ruania alba TaxID=648782 RepID=UPI000A59E3C3